MSKIKKMIKRKKNPNLTKLIEDLLKKSVEDDAKIWRVLAEKLAKPKNLYAEVNVSKIEKFASPNELVIVPGKVLGGGEIKKPIKVAALSFSGSARKKILEAKGECYSLSELLDFPKFKSMKIIG